MSLLLSIVAASPRRTAVTIDDWFNQSDGLTTFARYSQLSDDAAIITDAATKLASLGRDEGFNTADSIAASVIRTSITLDSIVTDDGISFTVFIPGGAIEVTLDDAITAVDSFISSIASAVSLDDSIPFDDNLLRSLSRVITAEDAITLDEILQRRVYFVTTVQDTIDVLDSFTASVASAGNVNVVALQDLLLISDEFSTVVITAKLAADALLTADEALVNRVRGVQLQDAITLDDVLLSYVFRTNSLTDTADVADSAPTRLTFIRSLLDQLDYADDATAVFISGAGAAFDVRLRIIRVRDDLRLWHDTMLSLSSYNELSVAHEPILYIDDEALLMVGGY
ncbi:hypothetical protein UFOVP820_58 [uncultured Caudovirales phage]|uniref:Uncharacterized protein n=1 Tax=uncultured Caudovirales phage TaxID=2100421 RepID=A0A6J5PD56_9CAUD|nr:hypothetical protein UFOVP820_58 [uncultured Caudovirales phage]